jgi:plastocyanin
MKKNSVLLLAGLILVSAAFPLRAEIHTVYWDFDYGFSPSTVTINSGDAVVWYNVDIYGLPLEIVGNATGFSLFLTDFGDNGGFYFTGSGTISYHDTYGNYGTVTFATVSIPPSPAVLDAPRLENGEFLFEATNLTLNTTTVLECSSNLITWLPLQTNVPDSTSLTFTNRPEARCQFFRIMQIP